MKKRILSLAMVLCLLLTLFPVTVFAENAGGVYYDGPNKICIEEDFVFTYTIDEGLQSGESYINIIKEDDLSIGPPYGVSNSGQTYTVTFRSDTLKSFFQSGDVATLYIGADDINDFNEEFHFVEIQIEFGHIGGTATCYEKAVCSTCGQEYGDCTGHTLTKIEAKNPTCTEDGNTAYWTCSVCHKLFSDEDGTNETTLADVTIKAGHTLSKTEAKDPTCTEDGNTAYWTCSVCNKYFSDETGAEEVAENSWVIKAAHKLSKTEAKAATCTEDGNTAYWTCSVCNKYFSDETGTEEIEKDNWVIKAAHKLSKTEAKAATCTEDGNTAYWTCSVCHKLFSDEDGTNETTLDAVTIKAAHKLTKTEARDATVTETGNIEYWQCQDCGDIFSDPDGKNEIALEDTVTAKLPPKIIEGAEQSVTAGEKKALSFRSNAAFSDFIRVELDGKTLAEKNYTAKEGSTVVTLNADYVSTLSAGEHTIGIVSESGTASTTFTVDAKANSTDSSQTGTSNTNSPQTGDNSPLALWIALLFVSGAGVIGTTVYGKKKRAK